MPARDLRLCQFQQSIRQITDEQTFEVFTFPGVLPIFVRRNAVPLIYQQSGEAVAFGARFNPPAPYASGTLIEQPQISYERMEDALQWKTTWSYTLIIPTAGIVSADVTAMCKWPTSPTFTTV